MNKRPWWQDEFLATETNQNIIKWLESQNKIKEWTDKERIIIKAYQQEISEKRDQILKLEIEIKELEKECNQCLAKISAGDTGLIALLAEKSSLK